MGVVINGMKTLEGGREFDDGDVRAIAAQVEAVFAGPDQPPPDIARFRAAAARNLGMGILPRLVDTPYQYRPSSN